ncbi:MAG: SDR family NAD(P)-dependent oxidoreductase [Spirochaetaceae bacterium]|nr:SDR family NAD(P)-dependent oxidoreductase [Spirochaetaceae bacterium]
MKKIIIITGASSGMGAEFARQLSVRKCEDGGKIDEIWIIARREDRLKELSAELTGGSGAFVPLIKPIAVDIGGRKGGEIIGGLLAKEAGGVVIDTLVNNAGFGTYGRFDSTDIKWQLDEIDLNVTSPTAITWAALPYMERGSRIINTASLAAFSAMGCFAIYAATKAYMLSFTLGLAAELHSKGVKVIALCPGPVDTEFSQVASEGVRNKVLHGKKPYAVVRHCLRSLEKGKKIAVMAPKWKFKAFLPRLFGRYFTAKVTMLTEKRPSKKD